MERQMRVLGAGVLLAVVGLTGCDGMSRSVNDAFARDDAPIETQSRLEQQLGDIPDSIDTTAAARLSGAFRAAAARALPAVVQIRTVAITERPGIFVPGLQQERQQQRTQGTGSGFVFDERGYILTNHHVVQNALSVNVAMLDGREYTAEVVGSDPNTDVAVIRIDPGDHVLPLIEIGESDRLRVGDWVIALGNPLGLTFTATAGIVSAKARSIGILAESGAGNTALESFIQTDAAINPGNSGGPLVDLNGRVIGINTAIESPTGYFTGAGFAIPIALAKKVADDIVEFGTVHRPRLGVVISDVNAADAEVYDLPSVSGVEVTAVTPGEPADRAGMQLGDVILTINGETVNTVPDLQSRVARLRPGNRVDVGFIRYGRSMSATVELGEFEPPRIATPTAEQRTTGNPLGFTVTTIPQRLRTPALADEEGPMVGRIDPVGPASGSGLSLGQIVRRFNGREIRNIRDLERAVSGVSSGDVVSLIVVDIRDAQMVPTIVNYRLQ
ncbi:MAG: trypsin-like peptidase domain-containing protein [Gemmatimonadetes bacterium]|nr:trypsin-like peptidase domain-containing protein [Gemmatimonadota bacterium]